MQYRVPAVFAKMLRASRTGSDPTQHLTQPIVLEDGRTPRILSHTLYTMSAFIIAIVLWAALCDVREVTFASGQIIPSGQVQNVNHLEGGIVAELLVREGERVIEGQPLVRLEPVATESDVGQLEVRRAGLALQIIRQDAASREIAPDFGAVGAAHPELAMEQARLYASTMDQRRQERMTLAARLAQRRGDVATNSAALETAKAQVLVARDLFEIQVKLISLGFTPTKIYLEAKSALLRAEGESVLAETKLKTALEAQAEAESALAAADTAALQKFAEERAKASNDLAETEWQVAKFSDRFERLVVRAPSAGLVQEIIPKAPGEVVKPGEMVARIVPSDYELVAEVRVDTKDSGYVHVGTRADVKFATYDTALFGTLTGTVDHISATTFPPQPGQPPLPGQTALEPYYKAIIRLPSNHVGTGTMRRPISTGMVVQASIVTGSKSIMRYLLKPLSNSLDVAFTER
jgi:membrane fusion protein, adhesin transport system